eukprot:Gb_14086 [translate_table: standard]
MSSLCDHWHVACTPGFRPPLCLNLDLAPNWRAQGMAPVEYFSKFALFALEFSLALGFVIPSSTELRISAREYCPRELTRCECVHIKHGVLCRYALPDHSCSVEYNSEPISAICL